MEKIVILNANNESMQVDVVRYFNSSNNKYFIFSLHEIDEQGHMNIYVTKIVDQNGTLIGTNIIDDVEWANLKTNLQRIIKENRANGNAVVNDLPYASLQNIKVADRRALKLLATSVDMLNLGYNPQESGAGQPINQSFEQPNVQNQSVNSTISQQNNENNLDIFGANVQNIPNNIQNMTNNTQNIPNNVQNMSTPVQNVTSNNNIQPQPVQNHVDNSISQNYKDLYFHEKENTDRLIAENNRLITELNNCKMIISDIKNILSRQ